MNIGQDLRFSARVLRKSHAFTIVAIVTLAVSIGANAVVFAGINSLILNPLNVPASDSFYEIERLSDFSAEQSYPDYIDLRDQNHSFDGLAAHAYAQAGLDTGTDPARVWIVQASGNYFDVLRIQPYLGRFFRGSEEHGPNSMPYIVLSYAYWHTHFHDDRDVVGRVVKLNEHPFTILGVAQPEFHGTLLFFSPDLYTPMVNQEQVEGGAGNVLTSRGTRWVYMTMGHLKPGVTPTQAGGDIDAIWAYLGKSFPKDHPPMKFKLARPGLYGDAFGRPVQAFLGALMLLALLILLAACANLGSLFAARAADRSREVALRLALGSSRKRILQQLFTEATLISLVGGALGIVLSIMLLRGLAAWRPLSQFPVNLPIKPDIHVYLVALLLSLASGFLFGAVPVRQILRTNSYEIIKAGSGGVGRRLFTSRDVLLVVQITICTVLVTFSMVAVRGLVRSMHGKYGFDPRNVMLVDTNVSMAGYSGNGVVPMQRKMIDAVQTIPGVTSVGLINWPPLTGDLNTAPVFTDQTADLREANAAAKVVAYTISPEYFQAAGTAVLAGRALSWHDDKNSVPVAVVNRQFAEKIFGSATDATGKVFKTQDGTRTQVVGIVEDGKYGNLTENAEAAMFLPLLQSASSKDQSSSEAWLVVRSNGDQSQMALALREKLKELDPGLPCFVETWSSGLALPLFPARIAVIALGVLGGLGAILSITGIFGVAASVVAKRRRELGIRVAVGATHGQASRAVMTRPFKLLVFGSVLGLTMGFLASRILAAIVYDATARDPLVLGGVVLAIATIGLLGAWIPVRQALGINASKLLRED